MSPYETLRFRIVGASPLLTHNGRLADPLDDVVKRIAVIASRRRKTEADHNRLAELEFKGGLYLAGGRPCIPEEIIEGAMAKAAGLQRRSMRARAGLVVRHPLLLEYDGPKDPESLWRDERFRLRCGVRIGAVRVMRTRPLFDKWEADLTVDFLPNLLNPSEIKTFLKVAGEQIGIGYWRPKYGRFHVEPGAHDDAPGDSRDQT